MFREEYVAIDGGEQRVMANVAAGCENEVQTAAEENVTASNVIESWNSRPVSERKRLKLLHNQGNAWMTDDSSVPDIAELRTDRAFKAADFPTLDEKRESGAFDSEFGDPVAEGDGGGATNAMCGLKIEQTAPLEQSFNERDDSGVGDTPTQSQPSGSSGSPGNNHRGATRNYFSRLNHPAPRPNRRGRTMPEIQSDMELVSDGGSALFAPLDDETPSLTRRRAREARQRLLLSNGVSDSEEWTPGQADFIAKNRKAYTWVLAHDSYRREGSRLDSIGEAEPPARALDDVEDSQSSFFSTDFAQFCGIVQCLVRLCPCFRRYMQQRMTEMDEVDSERRKLLQTRYQLYEQRQLQRQSRDSAILQDQ